MLRPRWKESRDLPDRQGVPLLVDNCDGNDISVLSYTIETRWWVPSTMPSDDVLKVAVTADKYKNPPHMSPRRS